LGPITTKLLDAACVSYRVVEECCGGAGVWGTFKENYDLSSEIATKLRDKVEPNTEILTESETCRLQIEAHVSAKVRFPVELLAERAYQPTPNDRRFETESNAAPSLGEGLQYDT
jgi:Fe-S oxidoreductase